MKRDRLEELGAIRILINEALDNEIFENIDYTFGDYFKMHGLDLTVNDSASQYMLDICELKTTLFKIYELAEGDEK